EIFLTKKNDPEKAAEYFAQLGQVSISGGLALSADINLGTSYYLAAERLQTTDKEKARTYFEQAFALFTRLNTRLTSAPKAEFAKALHHVNYYLALSTQRLWHLTSDPQYAEKARLSWRNYISIMES